MAITRSEEGIGIETLAGSLFYVRLGNGRRLAPTKAAEILDRREVEGGVLYVVRCAAGETFLRVADG